MPSIRALRYMLLSGQQCHVGAVGSADGRVCRHPAPDLLGTAQPAWFAKESVTTARTPPFVSIRTGAKVCGNGSVAWWFVHADAGRSLGSSIIAG